MTLVRVLRNILLVVVVLGTAAGDGDSVESVTEKNCRNLSHVLYDVVSKANDCAELGFNNEESWGIQTANTIEEYQQYFVGYCQKQSRVRECFSNTNAYFERCGNETYVYAFNIYRGILDTILDIGCIRDGEGLATFWRGFNILGKNRSEFDKALNCFGRMIEFMSDLEHNPVDMPSVTYIAYKEAKVVQECVLQVEMEASFKKVVETYLPEAINRMKCINPAGGSAVLCSTIDVTLLNATSVCDAKTNNNEISIYDALENQALGCFRFLADADTPLELDHDYLRKSFFPRICSTEDVNDKCLDKLRPYTEECLNETQLHEFTVLNETIRRSMNAACIEQGNDLSGVMIQVYELQKQSPGNKNAVLECLKSVLSARKQTDVIYISNTMRYYHELETFKVCFLQKLQGNESNVNVVNKLYDEIRKRVKCFNPKNGTTVLCQALVH